ncbi:hypothetical protein Btru_076523 [Bulinus truncatus]|nr:hypothetical protein Btru_076523 [Bulinus truncatus]
MKESKVSKLTTELTRFPVKDSYLSVVLTEVKNQIRQALRLRVWLRLLDSNRPFVKMLHFICCCLLVSVTLLNGASMIQSYHIETASPLANLNVPTSENSEDSPLEDINAIRGEPLTDTGLFRDPVDYYKCGPCRCYNVTTLTAIVAACGTVARTGIPQSLPKKTTHLDLSNNRYRVLAYQNISRYVNLVRLNLSSNIITTLDNKTDCSYLLTLLSLDLSSNKISKFLDGALQCTPRLHTLLLGNNHIATITNDTLSELQFLEILDLSYNNLTFIEYGAFDNTPSLKTLLLGHNAKLNYGKRVFNPRLFQPLTNLVTLSVERFEAVLQYPVVALSKLTNLTSLQLDGLPDGLSDVNLTTLRNLTTLKYGVDGFCRTQNIGKSFFEGFPFLRSVHIEKCRLKEFSPEAYDMNPLLEKLNYTDLSYPFDLLFSNLKSLQNSSLKVIIFDKITYGLKSIPCRALYGNHSSSLSGLRHLEELYLINNAISLVTKEFILGLPRSLKIFSVKGNMLNRVRSLLYLPTDKGFIFMPNLTTLIEGMQGVGDFYRVNPGSEPVEEYQRCRNRGETTGHVLALYSNHTSAEFPDDYDEEDLVDSSPSPKIHLRYYSASQSFHFGTRFMSGARKRKRYLYTTINLDLSNSYRTNWGSKTLKPWVEVADFSDNFCDSLTNHFLEPNNSLQTLFAKGNFLGQDIAEDEKGEKLTQFYGVTYLDLSGNHIQSIPYLFFKGLVCGRAIKLSQNKIVSLDIKLAHMTSLKFLDLSRNSISSISRRTMDDLDSLALRHDVFLDVTDNPFLCTCAGLELIGWLATTNVRLVSGDYIICLNEMGEKEDMGDISVRVRSLRRSCVPKALVLAVSLFTLAIVLIILSAVWVFKKRWWIIYIKNVYLAKLYGFKPTRGGAEDGYKFDAYLLYSPEDVKFVINEAVEELERKRGHRLCIEDRDMIAGTFVPCNIVSAVFNSRFTVPVFSPEFLMAEWTMYALHMSLMGRGQMKRDLVHLLCLRRAPDKDIPRELLKLLKDQHFIEYPPGECDSEVRKTFWDTISHTIGHGRGNAEINVEVDN